MKESMQFLLYIILVKKTSRKLLIFYLQTDGFEILYSGCPLKLLKSASINNWLVKTEVAHYIKEIIYQ